MSQFLTGIPEMDQLILSVLDPTSLFNVCCTDRYIAEVSGDPTFWRSLIINKYGPETANFKPVNQTFKEFYRLLLQFASVWEQCQHVSRDRVIKALYEQKGDIVNAIVGIVLSD